MIDERYKYLLPAPVKDLGDKMLSKDTHPNEKSNIASRLDAIKKYCEDVLRHTKYFRG